MTTCYKPNTSQRIDDPIVRLFFAFRSSGQRLSVYKHSLADLPIEQLSVICDKIIKTEDVIPSIATIRRMYFQMYKQMKSPEEAWNVFRQAWTTRSSLTLNFRSFLLQYTYKILSQEPITQMSMLDLHKRFLTVYREAEKQIIDKNPNEIKEML